MNMVSLQDALRRLATAAIPHYADALQTDPAEAANLAFAVYESLALTGLFHDANEWKARELTARDEAQSWVAAMQVDVDELPVEDVPPLESVNDDAYVTDATMALDNVE